MGRDIHTLELQRFQVSDARSRLPEKLRERSANSPRSTGTLEDVRRINANYETILHSTDGRGIDRKDLLLKKYDSRDRKWKPADQHGNFIANAERYHETQLTPFRIKKDGTLIRQRGMPSSPERPSPESLWPSRATVAGNEMSRKRKASDFPDTHRD